jgi:hypothetical protein
MKPLGGDQAIGVSGPRHTIARILARLWCRAFCPRECVDLHAHSAGNPCTLAADAAIT